MQMPVIPITGRAHIKSFAIKALEATLEADGLMTLATYDPGMKIFAFSRGRILFCLFTTIAILFWLFTTIAANGHCKHSRLIVVSTHREQDRKQELWKGFFFCFFVQKKSTPLSIVSFLNHDLAYGRLRLYI